MIRSVIREHNKAIIDMLEEFVAFCETLAKPENHIRVRSGQFVTKQIGTRTEADMAGEVARELTGLPKYTAYAKVLQDGGHKIWKGKIRTLALRARDEERTDTSETLDHVQINPGSGPTLVKQGVPPPVPRTVPRTDPPSADLVPKTKRPMKQRQPFDIYEDQYARRKQIADSERNFVNGRGMSQMVREAIDAYLATNKSPNEM